MSCRLHAVLSAPGLFGFMGGQPERLRAIGIRTTLVSAPSAWLDQRAEAEGAERVSIPICRDISLVRDAETFARLCLLFSREAPDIVLLSGPKAIFLGGMAAWLCGVPTRVAVYHGMRQENLRGPLRWVLDLCDRVSFACASQVLAVSPSLRALVLSRGLTVSDKIAVTGHGTANGVDPRRFALSRRSLAEARTLKSRLRIPDGAPVIGFVGRLTEDKGIADIYEAFLDLRRTHASLHLMLLGADEMQTDAGRALLGRLRADAQVRVIEHTDAVDTHMQLLSAQAFASSREGFGMVIAEAAALAVPTAAYDVTGVRDAIVHGETGLLVPHGDVAALAAALRLYLDDPALRRRHGLSGWHRVRRLYGQQQVWRSYLEALGLDAGSEPKLAEPILGPEEAGVLEEREKTLR